MNPTLLPTKQNQSESEQGGITDPQSRLLEGSSSKTTFVSRCHIPEGSQAQEFKEEQQSTSGTGRSSRRGRIRDVLLHWRGTETEKPTQPPAGWKHQDGRNYLQTVGQHYGLKTLLNNRCNQHSRTIFLLHIPYQQALSSAEGNVLEHDNRIALSSTKSVE